MRTRVSLLIALAILGCEKQEPAQTAAATTTHASPKITMPATQTEQIASGLQTPESVLYDSQQDVYFISNINGQPLDADNNGYISRVNPDSLAVEAKWIEGGQKGVTLNAPKGMAIANGVLWVSDINVVRKFDVKTGEPKGEMAIPGASFLNDLATDGQAIYVTDSGMKAGAGGNFEGTGTDSVWKISDMKATKLAKGKDLNRPNGVEIADGKVWVVTFGSNELYQLDDKGAKTNVVKMPQGSLDGLVHLSDGTFLVSSWDGKAVYRGPAAGPFRPVVENANAPADIGYDTKRHRLLIPHFMDSIVSIHDLQ